MKEIIRRTVRVFCHGTVPLLLLAPLVVLDAVAADPGLRERLGAERFESFGLSRLTSEELARLEAWLAAGQPTVTVDATSEPSTTQPSAAGRTAGNPVQSGAAQRVPTVQDFGNEQIQREERYENLGDRIQARIDGPFEGWEGKTLFRLDNGQIWRQRIGGRYRYKAESPAIEIVKGRFGYYLEVLETGRQVGVRRVR